MGIAGLQRGGASYFAAEIKAPRWIRTDDVSFELLTEQYFYSKSLRPATEWSYRKVVRSFEDFTLQQPAEITHLTVMNVFRYTAIRQNQLLHIRLGDINLEERWIDLSIEGARNHREHRVPVVSALYPSLEYLVTKAGEAGMERNHQVFNVGWFDLVRKHKYPEVMNEYPLRAFFRRLSRECKLTVTPHRFRHTVATHMMKSPERNLYAVKKLLGHVSITSTLEYIDESVDSLRDILETELM